MHNFVNAEQFASYIVENAGDSQAFFNNLPWLARVDALYHVMRALRLQGLPAPFARAALILWEVVATDELLTPSVGASMRAMTFAQLCEVVYVLSSLSMEQYAAYLNEQYAVARVA